MASKAAIGVLGLGLGVAGLVLAITSRGKAPPELPPGLTLTPEDIMASGTMGDLEVYFMYIGQLLVTKQIDRARYQLFYDAYVARFYELTGWQQ